MRLDQQTIMAAILHDVIEDTPLTKDALYQDFGLEVAELVDGRDNGWVRSGVRFLIGICEQAATLVPAGNPPRATPVASPSPVEAA